MPAPSSSTRRAKMNNSAGIPCLQEPGPPLPAARRAPDSAALVGLGAREDHSGFAACVHLEPAESHSHLLAMPLPCCSRLGHALAQRIGALPMQSNAAHCPSSSFHSHAQATRTYAMPSRLDSPLCPCQTMPSGASPRPFLPVPRPRLTNRSEPLPMRIGYTDSQAFRCRCRT